MALISLLSFAVVWWMGPTRPWSLSPVGAFTSLLMVAWLVVIILAAQKKTLNLKNLAFIAGYPILFALVAFSVPPSEKAWGWLESGWFIALCLAVGFLIGIVLLEYEFNWKQDKTFIVQPSDAWYLGQVMFMFYWAPRAALTLFADSLLSAVIATTLIAVFGMTAFIQDKARKERIAAGLPRQ